ALAVLLEALAYLRHRRAVGALMLAARLALLGAVALAVRLHGAPLLRAQGVEPGLLIRAQRDAAEQHRLGAAAPALSARSAGAAALGALGRAAVRGLRHRHLARAQRERHPECQHKRVLSHRR